MMSFSPDFGSTAIRADSIPVAMLRGIGDRRPRYCLINSMPSMTRELMMMDLIQGRHRVWNIKIGEDGHEEACNMEAISWMTRQDIDLLVAPPAGVGHAN